MLFYFDINTCIVTTVSGGRKRHSYAACDAALAASIYITFVTSIVIDT